METIPLIGGFWVDLVIVISIFLTFSGYIVTEYKVDLANKLEKSVAVFKDMKSDQILQKVDKFFDMVELLMVMMKVKTLDDNIQAHDTKIENIEDSLEKSL